MIQWLGSSRRSRPEAVSAIVTAEMNQTGCERVHRSCVRSVLERRSQYSAHDVRTLTLANDDSLSL